MADLVANLRTLAPEATILLYDGSREGGLLRDPAIPDDEHLIRHPQPRPMRWGRLHDFAIDSMRFALAELDFDALTIVDSDQLLLRPGYVERISAFLAANPRVGMLGNAPYPQARDSRVGPVRIAWREATLWRPLLAGLPGGADVFPHWTFWPSTVFSRAACADLVRLFDDPALHRILTETRIFATEEIVLPTLVAALGHGIAANPASYDFVRYRHRYTIGAVDAARLREDVFWIHPIPRDIDHPLRVHLRRVLKTETPGAGAVSGRLGRAAVLVSGAPVRPRPAPATNQLEDFQRLAPEDAPLLRGSIATSVLPDDRAAWPAIPPLGPLVDRMRPLSGWLEPNEAALLAVAAASALGSTGGLPIVETGSYAGRGTVLLGAVAADLAPALNGEPRVVAIDAFDGIVGDRDRRLHQTGPTLEAFHRNVTESGLDGIVETIVGVPSSVAWDRPIGLLVVDGLHDHATVAAEFDRFGSWLAPDGLVAFHDYAPYFPGVKRFVDTLLRSGRFVRAGAAGSLVILRPTAAQSPAAGRTPDRATSSASARPPAQQIAVLRPPGSTGHDAPDPMPLVSCVMPTYNRRAFVPGAIRCFLDQDYPRRELIIVDDGTEPIEDLIPADDRIRYLRVPGRQTIGEKRNIGCRTAAGELIAHWDDDDWVAGWRLSYEVDELVRRDADVVGLQTLLYLDPAARRAWTFRYRSGGSAWLHDPTLVYRRTLWEAHPFPDSNFGLDIRFVRAAGPRRAAVLEDHRFYVGILHAGNTSPKRMHGPSWQPHDPEAVLALMTAPATPSGRASGTASAGDMIDGPAA